MRLLTRSAWAFLFALFFVLASIMAICVLPASAVVQDYTLQSDDYTISGINNGVLVGSDSTKRLTIADPLYLGNDAIVSIKCASPYQWIAYYSTSEDFSTGFIGKTTWVSGDISDVLSVPVSSGTLSGAQYVRISFRDSSNPSWEPSWPVDSLLNSISISVSFSVPAPEYTYTVNYDGDQVISFTSTYNSCTLDLILNPAHFVISVDGYEDDYKYSDTLSNNNNQQFAGLSYQGDVGLADYTVGNRYEITLTPNNPTLNLTSVFKYPLYIDPNGGTWNYSSDVSVFWDYFGSDYDQIYNPTREGYVFDGWTFTGAGSFDESDPDDLVYTFGYGQGVLTANWSVSPDAPKSIIAIDGIPYVFTGTTEKPAVTLTVTSNGAILSYDSQSYTHIFSGTGTYNGLSFSSNGSASFVIDQTYPLSAGDHTLYSCVINVPSVSYETVIKIGSEVFTFTSSDAYPKVTITVTSSGCVLVDGVSGYTYTCTLDGQFLGLALFADSSESDFPVNEEIYRTGSDKQNVFQFYPFVVKEFRTHVTIGSSSYDFFAYYSSPDVTVTVTDYGCSLSDGTTTKSWYFKGSGEYSGLKYNGVEYKIGSSFELYGVNSSGKNYVLYPVVNNDGVTQGILSGFIDFLIIPVMAFFDVEFIPGFSFGKIALIAFIIGLVFWFLKASK